MTAYRVEFVPKLAELSRDLATLLSALCFRGILRVRSQVLTFSLASLRLPPRPQRLRGESSLLWFRLRRVRERDTILTCVNCCSPACWPLRRSPRPANSAPSPIPRTSALLP